MSSLLLRRSASTLTAAARSASSHQLKRCARVSRFSQIQFVRSFTAIEAVSISSQTVPSFQYFSTAASIDYSEDEDDDLFPTKHSSKLPPAVCPPSLLRSQVESLFDAPIGSLIPYHPPNDKTKLRSISDEIEYAYYQSDPIVQRVEYVMRGLNAVLSSESFVSRSLERGYMVLDAEGDSGSSGLTRQECFRAMMDILDRMNEEGEAFVEMRMRIRSQLMVDGDGSSSSSSSSSDSSDDDDDEVDEETVKQFTDYTQERMRSAGFATAADNSDSTSTTLNGIEENDLKLNPDDYQFGATPGVTVHMFDLLLDSLACLCKEQYSPDGRGPGASSSADAVDLIEVMEAQPPPEYAKDILDQVLHTHWMDGGDIGLGSAADASNALNKIAQGIGIGAGTGAGSLAHYTAMEFDVRTCPTPMTFNAVIRIASEFDHVAHANMVQEARVLSGNVNSSNQQEDDEKKLLQLEQDRLRDITLDAAFSTYIQMKHTVSMTLRSLRSSTRKATSRQALKRQAKILNTGYTHKKREEIATGRNAATYNYLIATLKKCIPPSISRGNMAYGLYHKACVQEGVMDSGVVQSMMGLGGYNSHEDMSGSNTPPPVSNGPLFDEFMMEELGNGVDVALERGRMARHDRNYRMRRFVEWDDTY